MSRKLVLAAVPAALLLAACGGGQEIPVTNDGNVVLNDAQANYAFTNDGEVTANMANEMNMTDGNMMMDNGMMTGGNMAAGTTGGNMM